MDTRQLDAHSVHEYWLGRAFTRAGIEPATWHPDAGVRENRETIAKVYEYYGKLYCHGHPELLWAAMAGMIGPAFAAGFQDLGILPDWVRDHLFDNIAKYRPRMADAAVDGMTADLGWFEETFLTMQQKIFEDQAPMHEAYVTAGIAELDLFHARGLIGADTCDAWHKIAAGGHGDMAAARCGNRVLLFREQYDIIDRYYLHMFQHHGVYGRAFTAILTLAGAPSIPGALDMAKYAPFTFKKELRGWQISEQTPLAAGNIALFQDRWALIEHDTLPKFLDFISAHPDKARDRLTKPLWKKAAAYRVSRRIKHIAAASLTHWHLDVDARPDALADAASAGQPPPARVTEDFPDHTDFPPLRETGLEVDLRDGWFAAPTARQREDAKPFAFQLTLADGAVFTAAAELVILFDTQADKHPDQLIVQLPMVPVADAKQLVDELAASWRISAEAVRAWHGLLSGISTSTWHRNYGAYILHAPDAGDAHVAFKIAFHARALKAPHHHREHQDGCAITAVFTRDS